jgi:3-hydroxymyristoyl/3-hydroxydecanoyl-(acyl carrier protein) dehydratase
MFELIHAATFDPAAGHARGWARIAGDHAWLADHFPGAPVLPGSVQLELCAQIAGPLAERAIEARDGVERWAFLGMIRSASFPAACALPAEVAIVAQLRRLDQAAATVATTCLAGDITMCRAELVMVLQPATPEWSTAIAAARARVAAWTARS